MCEKPVRGYLLRLTHLVGRFKARFFVALGYSADDWQTLEADFIQHLEPDAVGRGTTPYGQPTRFALFSVRTQRGVRSFGEVLV